MVVLGVPLPLVMAREEMDMLEPCIPPPELVVRKTGEDVMGWRLEVEWRARDEEVCTLS